jgi:hypothetical protein
VPGYVHPQSLVGVTKLDKKMRVLLFACAVATALPHAEPVQTIAYTPHDRVRTLCAFSIGIALTGLVDP